MTYRSIERNEKHVDAISRALKKAEEPLPRNRP